MLFRKTIQSFLLVLVIPVFADAREPASSPGKNESADTGIADPETSMETRNVSGAGRLEVPAGPRTIVSRFFNTLGKGRVDEAYTRLTEGSKIAQNAEQSALIRKKTTEAIEAFGKINGFELIDMEWAGTHLVRLTYLSLGENFPLRWRFYFYQRRKAWRLVDIRVDDSLKDVFHERGSSDDAP